MSEPKFTARAFSKGGQVVTDPALPSVTTIAAWTAEDMTKKTTEALKAGWAVEITNHN